MREYKEDAGLTGVDPEQIKRIGYFEDILDRAADAVKRYNAAAKQLHTMLPEIEELASYYESCEWRRDFEDDEAGLLPTALKRGVLSEDAIYDLLEEIKELNMADLPGEKEKPEMIPPEKG